jgi:hypothetical protein
MNIVTANKIKPIAERMAKGKKPSDDEIQIMRVARDEVQDAGFTALLSKIGSETTLRELRQAGKALLSQIRFATGARRKNDLPPENPRPEKIKRMIKQGKLLK